MTQFEQENDLGRGGGEVDDETMAEAWREADRRDPAAAAADRGEDPEAGAADEARSPSGSDGP
jgi:hypothetical protein